MKRDFLEGVGIGLIILAMALSIADAWKAALVCAIIGGVIMLISAGIEVFDPVDEPDDEWNWETK